MRGLLAACLAAAAAACAPAASAGGSRNVEVVVNPELYAGGEISAALERYLGDVRSQGYEPILTTRPFADADALRGHLAGRYYSEGLAGAVFLGDLPVASFEIDQHTGWDAERFAADLYFQDLDGVWTDANGNGVRDTHSGDVAPEIWLGRLTAGNLTHLRPGRTEAGLLNEYFARNHAYRLGRLTVAADGLAYVDDDWATWANTWGGELRAAVGGEVTIVSDAETTTAADYRARLAEQREHVLLCVHSTATRHDFRTGAGWTGGSFHNTDVAETGAGVLFYNLFACSGADHTTDGYIAGEYVFGTDVGLLAVGSAKTGSMLDFGDYFAPLGAGETFGSAWLSWWQARAESGFSTYERDWHYGMTLIGDPLLRTQAYLPIPEPGAAWLLAAAGAALLRRRRPRARSEPRRGRRDSLIFRNTCAR